MDESRVICGDLWSSMKPRGQAEITQGRTSLSGQGRGDNHRQK
jgi:hypothetical protein